MPEISKTVFYTGQPTGIEGCEIALQTKYESFAAKFDAWKASPYDNTLFLDNDTFVLMDLSKYIQSNEYVTALPYPNKFEKSKIRILKNTDAPNVWRNVNSGVVIFTKKFMIDYGKIWNKFGDIVLNLPGKDQCLFSMCLATFNKKWYPMMNLQITTTPFAVEFIRRYRNVPQTPEMGRVPLSLILDAYVFHYTADKEEFMTLFENTFSYHLITDPSRGPQGMDDLDRVMQEDLVHGKRFSAYDSNPHSTRPVSGSENQTRSMGGVSGGTPWKIH